MKAAVASDSDVSKFWIGIGFAAVTTVSWGVLGFGLKRAFQYSDPATVSWFRFSLAFALLGLWTSVREPETRARIRSVPWWMVPAAVGLALNYLGYAKGVALTTPGNAQMLSQLGPLFVVVGGILILKEALSRRQWIGVALALSGFLLFYRDQLDFFIRSQEQFQRGNAWILLGSVTWAAWALMQKRAMQIGHSARALNLFVYGWCSVVLLPFAEWAPFSRLNAFEWGLLVALALNTLIAYGSLAAALERAPTPVVNLVIATNPLLALALQHESVHLEGWFGAALVLTGVLLTLRPRSRT